MISSADLVDLFTKEFVLCKVKEGERVVVLAEPRSRQDYVGAAFAATQRLGAHVMVLTLPGGSPSGTPVVRSGTGYGLQSLADNELAVETLTRADLVIDLTVEGFIHTPLLGKMLGAHQSPLERENGSRARVLYICEPPEVLARNLPRAEDKDACLAGAQMLSEAKEMVVVSDAGTDLHIDMKDAVVLYQCGFADDPGRWDHWPSQMVLCFPRNERVNGKIVMTLGDALFPFKEFARDRIEFQIESGVVASVTGAGDAAIIDRFITDTDDEAAAMTSHFGWGLLRTADWSAMSLYNKESIMGMEARSYKGAFMWSTGPNHTLDRYTPYHLDFPMRNCTILLDGRTIVDKGSVVPQGLPA